MPPDSPPTLPDTPPRAQLHASPTVRMLLWLAGSTALLLGIAGIFLPVLPTTPFILLAAACYARASERFHRKLMAHATFGPLIAEWETYRSLPLRTKKVAVSMMSLSIAVSIWVVRDHLWLQLMLVAIGSTVGTWLWRLPSRDEPAPEPTPVRVSAPASSADASR